MSKLLNRKSVIKVKKYLEYIDNSMGEVNPIAKIRTETVLNSWKRQKEYKV